MIRTVFDKTMPSNSFYVSSLTVLVTFVGLLTRFLNDTTIYSEIGIGISLCFQNFFRWPSSKVLDTGGTGATFEFSSSVWCLADDDGHKICTFKNLCFSPLEDQFIFILTNDSVLSGIKSKDELKSLQLSSVSQHNQFTMKIAVAFPENIILSRTKITVNSVYILWRFKWDNIMHIIHDDLLPLYMTYSHICSGDIDKCISKYQLALLDYGMDNGQMFEWYKLFSDRKPILLRKYASDKIVCFCEVGTGMVRSSTWFQYGFGVPQGPINNTELTGTSIRKFSSFVLEKFNITPAHNVKVNSSTAVLFSRRINRKILNEEFILKVINNTYYSVFPNCQEFSIQVLDMSTNDTISILYALTQSKVVVGMHGAIMILSMFLPPESLVVELFPYGIISDNVSPVKSLSHLKGIHFCYESWENVEEKNSIPHPEELPIFGGISHLSHKEQQKVKSLIPIPPVECCHNPAYLYRMFQDTYIAPNFVSTFKHALLQLNHKQMNQMAFLSTHWWYPSSVSNATCVLTPSTINISWNPPINIEQNMALCQYIVTVIGENLDLDVVTDKLTLTIPHSKKEITTRLNNVIDVWIKSVVGGKESIDTYIRCKSVLGL